MKRKKYVRNIQLLCRIYFLFIKEMFIKYTNFGRKYFHVYFFMQFLMDLRRLFKNISSIDENSNSNNNKTN